MEQNSLGTDVTKIAAENSAYSEPWGSDSYPFSGKEIRNTFLSDGEKIGDTILRCVYEKDIAHLRAMQIEQGMRLLRSRTRANNGKVPDRAKDYAEMPAALLSSIVNGMVAAAKDGNARSEALVAWGGGAVMAKRRNVGSRVLSPRSSGNLS